MPDYIRQLTGTLSVFGNILHSVDCCRRRATFRIIIAAINSEEDMLNNPQGIIRTIEKQDNESVAALIRGALLEHDLAKPGTVYYDSILDHLYEYYSDPDVNCEYYVWIIDGKLAASAGYYPFSGFENCSELHKIYVDPEFRNQKLGYTLLTFVEEKARSAGYTSMYIETHSNLEKAVSLYRRNGYQEISQPDSVSHSAMNIFLKKSLADSQTE